MCVEYGVPFVSKLSNVSMFTEQSMFARHLVERVWLSNRYLATAVVFSVKASIFSYTPMFSYGSGI